MQKEPHNPVGNVLPAGIEESTVADAVSRSGYPIQTFLASVLRADSWYVQEEWSFIDQDSGSLRALDLHAEYPLYNEHDEGDARVYPGVTLLIECKQSSMPYVFFVTEIDDELVS